MNEGKISARYSKALFLTAKENNSISEVKQDMDYLLELTSVKEVGELLESPVIENRDKSKAMMALLKGKISELSVNLVKLTISNNRESYLPAIARAYIKAADKFNGVTKATLTTATRASDKVKKSIVDMVEKALTTHVDLSEIVDPGITGGFLLKVEDTFIDGSVKTQLRKIEKELKEEV